MDLSKLARHPGLKGRSVFVSGGGSGIGAAIVESFVDQGAKVAFVDIDEEVSNKLVAALKAQYGTAPLFIRCDLKDIAALRAAIAQAQKEHGDITVLVNNAANDQRHKWNEVTPELWDDRIATNLRHVFFAMQAVAPQMERAGGGAIVNFGSIAWKLAMGDMAGYVASKAGIHALTRSMARDLGPKKIRVNTVLPGWIMTERQKTLWLTPEADKMRLAAQCLKGDVNPVDVARLVLFLASDDARMCSAQEFTIDGGWA
ncbi:MAG TPA: SDR family oxidoreductase [Dongiaceae bacterium]|jgi:NAD(P)-dependent dehydrogenase (short-subunit alcohol dehydrogenase family)|nr:SDR family oxidoreductase [Dongiaceae bacterium]